MTPAGVILYGPPAAGKDTVTQALTRSARSRFALFPVLKSGGGKRAGYAMTTDTDLDQRAGRLLWEVHRYGARYAVDRDELARATTEGVPVVHCGSQEAVEAITSAELGEWLTVGLRCSREIAEQRLRERDPITVADRLAVWDATPRLRLALDIDTGTTSPSAAAQRIADAFRDGLPVR